MKLWRATISYKERKTAAGASLLFATKLGRCSFFRIFMLLFLVCPDSTLLPLVGQRVARCTPQGDVLLQRAAPRNLHNSAGGRIKYLSSQAREKRKATQSVLFCFVFLFVYLARISQAKRRVCSSTTRG
jgi:hypothetical protein